MWTCIGDELGRVKIALMAMIGSLLAGLTTATILLTLGTNLNTLLRQTTIIGVGGNMFNQKAKMIENKSKVIFTLFVVERKSSEQWYRIC